MIRYAEKVIVLVDSSKSKINKKGFGKIAALALELELEKVDVIITDCNIDTQITGRFEDIGITVTIIQLKIKLGQ